jgi:hypothetical protein
MHKAFSKNKARKLFLVLLIGSTPAWAAYSNDPDCQAVSNGARAGADRDIERVKQAVTDTGKEIERVKSCIDDVVSGANRMITDFGGGGLSAQMSQALAKQACKMISKASNSAQSSAQNYYQAQVPQALQQPIAQQVTQQQQGAAQPAPAAGTSIFQRLANIF